MQEQRQIQLGSRLITQESRPYIIAEIGVNHEGSLETAKKMIGLAKEGGADAVKFQSYKAKTLASKNSPSYWDTSKEPTRSQYELFGKYDSFGQKEYEELAWYCREVHIDFLSTPFDLESVAYLSELMPFFKIASADLTSIPLLRSIGRKGKPVVLSTGASTMAEIDMAIAELASVGCKQLALLHCILNYPTEDKDANLGMIAGLLHSYPGHIIGYSDHTLPDEEMFVLTAAVNCGARIIEKHFTHDKSLPGNDHYHAMDTEDLKKFSKNLDRLERLTGASLKKPIASEELSRKNARRSIVLACDLKKGHRIRESDITFKRPAHGISPLHWDEVIGMQLLEDLQEDTVLEWRHLSSD